MVDNDGSLMEEIVAFVDSYGWREVVTVYIDYGYEINTISALGNALTTYKYSDSGLMSFSSSGYWNVEHQLCLDGHGLAILCFRFCTP